MRNICSKLKDPPVKSSNTLPMLHPSVLLLWQFIQAWSVGEGGGGGGDSTPLASLNCIQTNFHHSQKFQKSAKRCVLKSITRPPTKLQPIWSTLATIHVLDGHTYLGYILDQRHSQLDVGEDVEEVQPGQLATHRHKEGDENREPHECKEHHGRVGDPLTTSQEGAGVWTMFSYY